MPKFLKHEVVAKILDIGLLPVFYHGNIETAKKIIQACADGGAKVIESTNRGDRAYQVFSEIAKYCDREIPDIILGAGTIIDPSTASLYINEGADFIVSPLLNPDIAKICNRRKVAYIPGCSTPSEVSTAEEMGADVIKVFPAIVTKPDLIKAMLGPCPSSKLMPSGGIKGTQEDISAWIKAGAAALNIGTALISKDLVNAGDFEAIKKRVEQCILWIREARGDPLFLGVEHVAFYPNEAKSEEIVGWYEGMFGFTKIEGRTSFVISGKGHGQIEVLKNPEESVRCHIAIRVANFEKACEYLKQNGVELEEPIIKKKIKAVYLRKPDPVGNRVHLIYEG